MPVTYTETIDAPLKDVFACLDDASRGSSWMKGTVGIRYLSESGESSPGVRFKQKVLQGGLLQDIEGEVLHYQKPSYLAVRVNNESFEADMYYRLVSVDGERTRLHYEADVRFSSVKARLKHMLLGWWTGESLKQQIRALKQAAEARL